MQWRVKLAANISEVETCLPNQTQLHDVNYSELDLTECEQKRHSSVNLCVVFFIWRTILG